MSIGLTTSLTLKSCNYNKAAGRWEELEDTAPVCSCCDSMCTVVQDSTKNTVSSPGWLIGQSSEHQPRMAGASFQAERERNWVDEDNMRDKLKDERRKEVQTLLRETEIGHEEENNGAIPEKNAEETKRKDSAAVSQQEEVETEEVVMEKELGTNGIMSYQMRSQEPMEEVHSTRNGVVSSLSSVNSNTNASDGSGTTIARISSSLSIEYNAGSAENISRAINPNIKRCPNRDQMSCSATFNSTGRGAMYTAIGAESFTPNSVSATSGTSSPWDSRVNGSLRGNRPKTLDGTPSDTWNFEPIGFLNVSKLGESRLKSKTLDTFPWSEEVESVSKSVGTKLQGQAVDSVISKGRHGDDDYDDDMLQSFQNGRLALSQSAAHPADFTDPNVTDWLLGVSDFDSGIEDEVSGSVGSEEMHEDRSSHSAVVAVSDVLQGSESSQMFDREWAEEALGWGLHTLGFVVEQPTEDDFY